MEGSGVQSDEQGHIGPTILAKHETLHDIEIEHVKLGHVKLEHAMIETQH